GETTEISGPMLVVETTCPSIRLDIERIGAIASVCTIRNALVAPGTIPSGKFQPMTLAVIRVVLVGATPAPSKLTSVKKGAKSTSVNRSIAVLLVLSL